MNTYSEHPVVKSKKGMLRAWILLAVFLIYVVAFFDRANIIVLIANFTFTNDLGITNDKSAQGMLMTVFLLLYGVSCFFAGPVVHRFGPRKTLSAAIIIWGVLMGIMGAAGSFAVMVAGRALLGLGEAVVGPAVSKTIQTWFSPRERSKANGVWYVGIMLAPVIAVPLVVWFVSTIGWRGSFFALGLMGLIPALVTWYAVRDIPSTHPKVGKEELEQIMVGREEEGKAIEEAAKGDFGFLRQGSFWYLTIMYGMINCVMWGLSTWLPTYFMTTLGFSWKAMGILAAMPYVCAAVCVIGLTPFMDKLNLRSPFVIILALGVAISIICAMMVKNSYGVVLIFCITMALAAPTNPALFSMLQNSVKPNQISLATGFFNGFSYAFAAIAPILMGAMYNATGSLHSGFYFMSAAAVIGALVTIPLLKKRL
jgi:sugar phosphate permease